MKRYGLATFGLFLITGVMTCVWAAGGPPRVSSPIEQLGMRLYKDRNLSLGGVQSCQTCHHPFAGFADRKNLMHPEVNVVSIGADGVSKGDRNAPSSAYAGFSPKLHVEDGEYVGGLFWDGRADGSILGDPLAEQAQGPPLNPVEMAMESPEAVIQVIRDSDYVDKWYAVFGSYSLDNVEDAWNNFGRALAAYERSGDVTKFSSKFDVDRAHFTAAEKRGMSLFANNCARCHALTADFEAPAALLTTYRYANIGLPANPLVVLSSPDIGLGKTTGDSTQDGKFKIPTLRNIAVTAPYGHTGSFASLDAMVRFVNDRSAFTPEVDRNIDEAVGNLGLAEEEINDIVAFLLTLTDSYD